MTNNNTKPEKKTMVESLSWAGKLFFAGVAAYLLGQGINKMRTPLKVRGTPEQMRSVVDAIASSKRFQQEMSKPGATIQSVIDKLQIRNISKERFKVLTGRNWPI